MSDDQGISESKTAVNIDSLNQSYNVSVNGNTTKGSKVLLSELERLFDLCTEDSNSKEQTSSKQKVLMLLLKNDPAALSQLCKKAAKDPTASPKLNEILNAVSSYIGLTKGCDNRNVASMLQELVKGTPVQAESEKFLSTGKEMFTKFTEALNSGKTTLKEAVSSAPINAFIDELSNPTHLTTFKGVKSSLVSLFDGKKGDDEFIGKVLDIYVNASINKTSDGQKVLDTLTSPEKLSAVYNSPNKNQATEALATQAKQNNNTFDSYVAAMMSLAVSLSNVISNVMDAESSTSQINTQIIQKQGANAKTVANNNLSTIQAEAAEQAANGTEPWYMYLVAVVISILGAALAFFTGPEEMAAVGLVISLIMSSPAGGIITNSLSTAIGGTNPSMGAQVGATAIIAVLTTVLSLGAGGFSSASSAVDGAEQVGTELTEVAAGDGGDAAEGAAEGASDAIDDGLDDGLDDGGAQITEEATEKTITDETKAGAKSLSKIAQKFKNLLNKQWSTKALTSGLLERSIGTYCSQFIGSGGLTQSAEAIAIVIDPTVMDSTAAALSFAILGALVSIGGSVMFGALTTSGYRIRASYLQSVGRTDLVFKLSQPLEITAKIVQDAAILAQAGFSIYQSTQWMDVANLQKEVALSDAQQSVQKYATQQTNTISQDTAKQYNAMVTALTQSMSEALSLMGEEEQNTSQAL